MNSLYGWDLYRKNTIEYQQCTSGPNQWRKS